VIICVDIAEPGVPHKKSPNGETFENATKQFALLLALPNQAALKTRDFQCPFIDVF
jgi:hypothetical protein